MYEEDADQPISASSERLLVSMNDAVPGDLGVEEEMGMDPPTIAARLGFVFKQLPLQFNTHRHQHGITPWDDPARVFKQKPLPKEIVPLELHWHQLAGLHSILRNTFSPTPDPHFPASMLISDEVGLGKTTLCLSMIAALNQYIHLQRKSKPLPPILRKLSCRLR